MYKITEEEKIGIINDLGRLPYNNVAGLIGFFSNLKKEEIVKSETKEVKKDEGTYI